MSKIDYITTPLIAKNFRLLRLEEGESPVLRADSFNGYYITVELQYGPNDEDVFRHSTYTKDGEKFPDEKRVRELELEAQMGLLLLVGRVWAFAELWRIKK